MEIVFTAIEMAIIPLAVLLILYLVSCTLSWAMRLVSFRLRGGQRYSWWNLWTRQSMGGD